MTKANEITARSPSVGADEGQSSKTYTPISAETANRFRSDLSLKPRRAERKQLLRLDPSYLLHVI